MENKRIARQFKLLAQLLEFHGENPFKVGAIDKAARKISKLPFHISLDTLDELSQIPGIGKSTAAKVRELLQTGSIEELSQIAEGTPPGILGMLKTKGIGAKKVAIIWKELGIDNLSDLWHACNNDRLSDLKGFGKKTQIEIQKIVEFTLANDKKFRYADAEKAAIEFLEFLKNNSRDRSLVSFTGAFRRNVEVLDSIDFLAAFPATEARKLLEESPFLEEIEEKDNYVTAFHKSGFHINIFLCREPDFCVRLFETTGNEHHVHAVKSLLEDEIHGLSSEEAIYEKADLAFIPPALREGINEIALAKDKQLPRLIEDSNLKGSLHNHSTWSDGVFSVEEMALYCRDILKLDYFGISDHSKTAVYADGLKIDEVKRQWKEIDILNEKLAPFRIFKGIESDILNDGSLDYPDEVLAGFDLW